MGSQLKKGQWSQSTRNRVEYVGLGLWVFMAMMKANTDAKGNLKGTKKKISRIDLCRYMAEHNKLFRYIYLKTHPNKAFPKHIDARTIIGEAFYLSNVADLRRYVRRDSLEKEMKRYNKKPTQFRYFDRAKVRKLNY